MVNIIRKAGKEITNKDDARMIRYAYNGYSGFVKNYGNEEGQEPLSYTLNSSNSAITINKGIVVIDGWEIAIPSEGETITIDAEVGYSAYSVYLEINAMTPEEAKIKTLKETRQNIGNDYPVVNKGDDLTNISSGTARLPLYSFYANQGAIIDNTIVKQVKEITRTDDLLENDRITVKNSTNAKNATNVTSQINGHNISDIFESNSTTVKNSINASQSNLLKSMTIYEGGHSGYKNKAQINKNGIYIVSYRLKDIATYITGVIAIRDIEEPAVGISFQTESIGFEPGGKYGGSQLIKVNDNAVDLKVYLIAEL